MGKKSDVFTILFETDYKSIFTVLIMLMQISIILSPGMIIVAISNKLIGELPWYSNCIICVFSSSCIFYSIYVVLDKLANRDIETCSEEKDEDEEEKNEDEQLYENFLVVLAKTIKWMLLVTFILVLVFIFSYFRNFIYIIYSLFLFSIVIAIIGVYLYSFSKVKAIKKILQKNKEELDKLRTSKEHVK